MWVTQKGHGAPKVDRARSDSRRSGQRWARPGTRTRAFLVRSPNQDDLPGLAGPSLDVPRRGSEPVNTGENDRSTVASVCRTEPRVGAPKGQEKGKAREPKK